MPRIRDEFLECVVYLYSSLSDAERGANTGGCGFLVGVPTSVENVPFLYVVTNRHVAEAGNSVIRINSVDDNAVAIEIDERDWVYHPSGDDLAVLLLDALSPKSHKYKWINHGSDVNRLMLRKEDVEAANIGEGDPTFVVGRFVNHQGIARNRPAVRFGHISQIPFEPIETRFNGRRHAQESYLVESHTIGGFSGGPVFVDGTYAPQLHLLGVAWGYVYDHEPIFDKLTGDMNPYLTVRANTGVMGVVPAWKLVELLDCPNLSAQRTKIEPTYLENFWRRYHGA